MNAPDEVRARLTGYFEEDRLPADDYKPAAVETEDQEPEISRDEEGRLTFEKAVPGAFKKFVKKAVEKKAYRQGIKKSQRKYF